jgi:hypothetical protein
MRDRLRAARDAADLALRRATMLATTCGHGRPICTDVAEWAGLHQDAESVVLLEARRLERRPPNTVAPEVHDVYASRRHADQPERRLVAVHDARLVGARGLVVLPDGSVAAESAWGEPLLERDPDHLAPRRRPVVWKPGHWCSLVVHWSGTRNYYHWLHDVLARLHGVLERVPPDTRFVVPAGLRPFQVDSLRYLGIDGARIVPFDGREVWQLETLHFAPRVSNVGSDRGEADRWLRDALVDGALLDGPPFPRAGDRRIHISRRNAAKRRVVNDDEATALLERHGFETVLTEELSLREQIALFAQAGALVSTHGAGLTNMLYAAPGLRVVDMLEPGMLDVGYIYWAMADELDHEYWYLVTEPVPRPGFQNDTIVPIDRLAATLERMRLTT